MSIASLPQQLTIGMPIYRKWTHIRLPVQWNITQHWSCTHHGHTQITGLFSKHRDKRLFTRESSICFLLYQLLELTETYQHWGKPGFVPWYALVFSWCPSLICCLPVTLDGDQPLGDGYSKRAKLSSLTLKPFIPTLKVRNLAPPTVRWGRWTCGSGKEPHPPHCVCWHLDLDRGLLRLKNCEERVSLSHKLLFLL